MTTPLSPPSSSSSPPPPDTFRECLLFGAFADDACAHAKRLKIPGASPQLASLLLGGTLPPSTASAADRPPPPAAALPLAAAAVGADGFALTAGASAAGGGGLWQCQFDRGTEAAVWSRVRVAGLPEGERYSAVAVGDTRCLVLAAADGSVFAWKRRQGGPCGGEEEEEEDDGDEKQQGRARCVLGPRLEPPRKRRRSGGGGDGDAAAAAEEPPPGDPPLQLLRMPIAAIAAGRRHCLAVARPPHAACFAWGCNARGQCGAAPPGAAGSVSAYVAGGKSGSFIPRPRLVEALGGVPCSLCAAGDQHSIVASADGASVFAFGDCGGGDGGGGGGGDGNGGGSVALVSEEDLPLGQAPVVALAAGGKHGVALDADGRAYAWGAATSPLSSWGQRPPPEASSGAGVEAVVAGWRHTALVLRPPS